jgi:hypothetical protein
MISWEQWSIRWGTWSDWRANSDGSNDQRTKFLTNDHGKPGHEVPALREQAAELPALTFTTERVASAPRRRRAKYSFRRSH